VVILVQNLPYSFAAAEAMVPHILGSYRAYLDTCTSWSSIKIILKYFYAFGGIPIKNGQISQGGTGNHYQARKYNRRLQNQD
jgi:biotin/methionine sulfoxide reductase